MIICYEYKQYSSFKKTKNIRNHLNNYFLPMNRADTGLLKSFMKESFTFDLCYRIYYFISIIKFIFNSLLNTENNRKKL